MPLDHTSRRPDDTLGMPQTHFANTAVMSAMGSGELTLLNSANQVLIG